MAGVPEEMEHPVSTTKARPSYILGRAQVRTVERISPSFVRIAFGGPELAEVGTPGDVHDVRIKLIFPPASGVLPAIDPEAENWHGAWLAVPEEERGSMRTYSIRELRVDGADTEVVIDFVLHLAPGLTGPASLWASTAAAGDEILLIGPRRDAEGRGGIEYRPGPATHVLLAGDETAAPAIARILEDIPRDSRGTAFIEVPTAEDVLPIDAPEGFAVRWLPREGAVHGELLIPAVLAHLGDADDEEEIEVQDVDGDDLVWETPVFSSLGEELGPAVSSADRYYWIAGESGVVTTLRRHLVRDLGIARPQVAFMGYWRHGVAMRG